MDTRWKGQQITANSEHVLRDWPCVSQSTILSQSYYAGSIGSPWKPELSIKWHYFAISAHTTMRCHGTWRTSSNHMSRKGHFVLPTPCFLKCPVFLEQLLAWEPSQYPVWRCATNFLLKLRKTSSIDSFKKRLKNPLLQYLPTLTLFRTESMLLSSRCSIANTQ